MPFTLSFLQGSAISSATVAFLLAFPALFSIVNPFGASLIFAQATAGRSQREILALSRLVAFYSFMIILISVWLGGKVLVFFGITVSA